MIASRVPIFAPTRRPQGVSEWRVDTPWGWAIISGRLGQQHHDLLDAARMVAAREEWTQDGRLHLKIDPSALRSALGGDAVNGRRINEWVEDLRKARIELHIADRVIVGGLVSEYEIAADPTILLPRPGAHGDGRRYMRLSFSTAWSRLVEDEQAMRYPLSLVVQLRHGFAQAVARYCLSHRSVRDTVAGLVQKLGADGRVRNRRGELERDSERLAVLGITIDGNAVRYSSARNQNPVENPRAQAKSGDPHPKSGARTQSPVIFAPYQDYQDNQACPGAVAGARKTKPITPPCPPLAGKQRQMRLRRETQPTTRGGAR